MKYFLLILITSFSFSCPTSSLFAQDNIKIIENLVEKTVDEIDIVASKYNFKILESNFVRSTSDTSLYGMEAKWKNNRNEVLFLERMMDYVPLISKSDSIEVGKVKVLKKTVSLIISGQNQANSILNSLKLCKYKKISSMPVGHGFEVKYENENYDLTFRKISVGKKESLVYYFIVEAKAYQIIKQILYDKN